MKTQNRLGLAILPLLVVLFLSPKLSWSCSIEGEGITCLADFDGSNSLQEAIFIKQADGTWLFSTPPAKTPLLFSKVGNPLAAEKQSSGSITMSRPTYNFLPESAKQNSTEYRGGWLYTFQNADEWFDISALSITSMIRFHEHSDAVTASGYPEKVAKEIQGNKSSFSYVYLQASLLCDDNTFAKSPFYVGYHKPLYSAESYQTIVTNLNTTKFSESTHYRCDGKGGIDADGKPVKDEKVKGLLFWVNGAAPMSIYIDDVMAISSKAFHFPAPIAFDFGGNYSLPYGVYEDANKGFPSDFIKMVAPEPFPQQGSVTLNNVQQDIDYGWVTPIEDLVARCDVALNSSCYPWLIDSLQGDFISVYGDTDKKMAFQIDIPKQSKKQTFTIVALLFDAGNIINDFRYRYMEREKTLSLSIDGVKKSVVTSPLWKGSDVHGWFEQALDFEPEMGLSVFERYFDHRREFVTIPVDIPPLKIGESAKTSVRLEFAPGIHFPLAALAFFPDKELAPIESFKRYLTLHQLTIPIKQPFQHSSPSIGNKGVILHPLYSGDSIQRFHNPTQEEVESFQKLSAGEALSLTATPGEREAFQINLHATKKVSSLSVQITPMTLEGAEIPPPEILAVRYDLQKSKAINTMHQLTFRPYTLQPLESTPYLQKIEKGENRPIHIRFDIPKNQPHGIYSGQVTIKDGGNSIISIPLRIKILPYTFAKSIYQGGFYLYGDYRFIPLKLHEWNQNNCYYPWLKNYNNANCVIDKATQVPSVEKAAELEIDDLHKHHFVLHNIGLSAYAPVLDSLVDTEWKFGYLKDNNLIPKNNRIILLTSPLFNSGHRLVTANGALCGSAKSSYTIEFRKEKLPAAPNGCQWEEVIILDGKYETFTKNTDALEYILYPRIKKSMEMVYQKLSPETYTYYFDINGEIDSNMNEAAMMNEHGKVGLYFGCTIAKLLKRAATELQVPAKSILRLNGMLGMAVACNYCNPDGAGGYTALPAPVYHKFIKKDGTTASYSEAEKKTFEAQNLSLIANSCQISQDTPLVDRLIPNHALLTEYETPSGNLAPMRLLFETGREVSLYHHGYGRYSHGFYMAKMLADLNQSKNMPFHPDGISDFMVSHEGYMRLTGECLNQLDSENWGITEGCGSTIIETLQWNDTREGVEDYYNLETAFHWIESMPEEKNTLRGTLKGDLLQRIDSVALYASVKLPAPEIGIMSGWNGFEMNKLLRLIQNHTLLALAQQAAFPPVMATVDYDGDGIMSHVDNCPLIANTDQADLDQNGLGDACQFTAGDIPTPPEEPYQPDCSSVPGAVLKDGECVTASAADKDPVIDPTPIEGQSATLPQLFTKEDKALPDSASGLQLGGGGGCSLVIP